MKSIRLNQAMRDDMISAMNKHYDATNPAPYTWAEIALMENTVARDLYKRFLSKYDSLFSQVPERFLNLTSQVYIGVDGGDVIRLDLTDKEGKKGEMLPGIRNGSYSWYPIGCITMEEQQLLMEPINKARDARKDWDKAKQEVLDEARQLLDSVTTTKSLFEVWPEGSYFLPPYAADPSHGMRLPALRTSRLNAFLGVEGVELPVEE